MTSRSRSLLVAVCLLEGGHSAHLAAAQPAPQEKPTGDKVDAKALMQSGVRLLEAKDYLGALAIFKSAYVRFPSAKILLNIGTTLNLLGRKADAANAYQRYLDASDADAQKKPEVATVIAELDKDVGLLEITVTPPAAEVQINDDEWGPAASTRRYRVNPGAFTVRARMDRFGSAAKSAQVNLGDKAAIALALVAVPEAPTTAATSLPGGGTTSGADIVGGSDERVTRSAIGGYLMAHLDIPRGGGAALVGITADILEAFTVQGAVILGPNYGAYTGVAYAFLAGKVRPFGAAGTPIFFSNGPRMGLRVAAGVELEVTRHVSLLAELGLEYMLNPEDDIRELVFIPAIGAIGRL